jgi:hypothetical protein
VGSASLCSKELLITSRSNDPADLPTGSSYTLEPGHPSPGWPTLLRPPFTQTPTWWYRNINLFPIDYAFRPRLRDRLTLRGLTLLRKPWAYGDKVFHLVYRYSCQHTLFCFLQRLSRDTFAGGQNAPLPSVSKTQIRSFGTVLEPRYIFGAGLLDQ